MKFKITVIAVMLLTAIAIFSGGALASPPPQSSVNFPEDAAEVTVKLKGEEILDGYTAIINSTTYVPLRKFCNLVSDCEISWNDSRKTATVKADGLTLTAKSGEIYITANDRCFSVGEKTLNIDGTLFVPIRPIAKAFCLDVEWDAAQRCVNLTASGESRLLSADEFYDSEDLYWLSRIISAESDVEPMIGQIAVGNVVLNRVNSRYYPDTIYDVIFDFKHGIQFTPAYTGTVNRTPSQSSIAAAKICLEGFSVSDDIIYFLDPSIATNFWIVENCIFVMNIGSHDFYTE